MKSVISGLFVFLLMSSLNANLGIFRHTDICKNLWQDGVHICLFRDDVVVYFDTIQDCHSAARSLNLAPDGCYQPVWPED